MGQVLIDHLAVAIVIVMIAAVAFWHVWAFYLKPLAIPKAEIDAIVDELIDRHGPDAEDWARSYEEEAWHRSDIVQQGRWRRIRRELWRRHRVGEWE
ncbi:hypothetical protein [Chelativorans sp. Marseille-P2723]|uniref:hypothetical protein n=1 Tax=Chelativorans sp. Marseille-P2723 TaxID=2709133 RepID=UPI00157091C0|nr:hypothetical protein [Chelativorans sp. Marseille-P2723]